MDSNLPLSDQYAEIGEKWARADFEASKMEVQRSARLAEFIIALGDKIPHNRAESQVKASADWQKYNEEMVTKRRDANLLKVQMEAMRMAYGEWQSQSANERVQARL